MGFMALVFLQVGKLMDMKKEEAEKKFKGALEKNWMAKLGEIKV